jgi:hypothetical protein
MMDRFSNLVGKSLVGGMGKHALHQKRKPATISYIGSKWRLAEFLEVKSLCLERLF